jgi:phage tail-like protein
MDANGTKFHLLYGEEDWARCARTDDLALEGTRLGAVLQLKAESTEFQIAQPSNPPPLLNYGAAQDEFGTWYWVSEDGQEIRQRAKGATTPSVLWKVALPAEVGSGDFVATQAPAGSAAEPAFLLRGLAITTDAYLVVGLRSSTAGATGGAVVAFDLNSGAMRWLWPDEQPARSTFAPHTLVPARDGGAWVLDVANQYLWRVYTTPRTVATSPAEIQTFTDSAGNETEGVPFSLQTFEYWPLKNVSLMFGSKKIIALTRGPQDKVLFVVQNGSRAEVVDCELNAEATGWSSTNYALKVRLRDEQTNSSDPENIETLAATFVEYQADCTTWLNLGVDADKPVPLLVVADANRTQAIAFRLDGDVLLPDKSDDIGYREALPDFLPLRRWGGRGFVGAGCRVYYDSAETWLALQFLGEPLYARRGVLITPDDFSTGLPAQPFDGGVDGCVWHRLVLDAVIPAGSSVSVRARAANAPDMLADMPWIEQPAPYLRGDGAELPYYQLPAFNALDPALQRDDAPLSEECLPGPAHRQLLQEQRSGSWEVLFQDVRGRFIQLELTLEGTGRNTPQVHALRAWYPRFSYLQRYLPAIYREESVQASFLDRWLANFEGFYTHLEDQINLFPNLIDPRTAPAEALEWLASWMGLLLDPQWSERRRRFFIRHAMDLYRLRGTPLGLELVLRLYVDDTNQINDDLFRRGRDGGHGSVSALTRRSPVRVSEDFRTVMLLADAAEPTDTAHPRTHNDVAHHFTITITRDESRVKEDMIRRIAELEKPAHTSFTIKRGVDAFRVGCAILEVDSLLCNPSPAQAIPTLGENPLGDWTLPIPPRECGQITLDRDLLCDGPTSGPFSVT